MLFVWIVLTAVVYAALLSGVLAFFTSVSRMNRHWERVFRESHGVCDSVICESPGALDESWRRAA